MWSTLILSLKTTVALMFVNMVLVGALLLTVGDGRLAFAEEAETERVQICACVETEGGQCTKYEKKGCEEGPPHNCGVNCNP